MVVGQKNSGVGTERGMTFRDRTRGVMGACLLGFAILGVLGGCGSGGAASTEALHGARAHPRERGRLMSMKRVTPRRSIPGSCGRAVVAVGKNPGVLKIMTRCVPSKSYPGIGFTMGRFAPGRGGPAIEPGHVKKVTAIGSGAGGSHPNCSQLTNAWFCGVTPHGPVKLRVILEVRPKTRCQLRVSMRPEFEGTCRRAICFGVDATYALYSGRPKGC